MTHGTGRCVMDVSLFIFVAPQFGAAILCAFSADSVTMSTPAY
jgi:hypothetical protein